MNCIDSLCAECIFLEELAKKREYIGAPLAKMDLVEHQNSKGVAKSGTSHVREGLKLPHTCLSTFQPRPKSVSKKTNVVHISRSST